MKEYDMKVRKLIKKMYEAIVQHKEKKEEKIYKKITKKSLKGKKTQVVQ